MHRRYFILPLFCFIIILANTQPTNHSLKDFQKAEALYNLDDPTEKTDQQALQLYQQVAKALSGKAEFDSVVFQCHLKSGILQQAANNQQASINYFVKAIDVKNHSSLADSMLFQPYLYIGSAYYATNDFDSAVYFFKKSEDILDQYPALSERERLFNKTGSMYFETGNYVQSKIYFEKALALLDTTNAVNTYLLVNYKNNIASAMRKLRNYDEALGIYQSLLSYGIETNGLLHNIGDTYLGKGDYKKAIQYLRSTTYSTQIKYNDLGFAYLNLQQFDSAAYFLEKALDLSRDSGKSISKGVSLSHLGRLKLMEGKTQEALEYYQRSIIQLDPDFNEKDIGKNPVDFRGIHSMFNLFEALVGKANAFYAHGGYQNNDRQLELALSTLQSAFTLADRAFENSAIDEARFFLNDKVQPAYKQYVEWALQLYHYSNDQRWMRQAIIMAEKSKALVLRSSLQQLPLSNIRGIPAELIRQEKNLKTRITRLSLGLNSISDSITLRTTQQELLDAQIDLAKIHAQLDQQPAYAALMSTTPIDLENIQKQFLEEDQAILSFYFTQTDLITFVLTKKGLGYRTHPLSTDLLEHVQTMVDLIRKPVGDREAVGTMQRNLYDELISPALDLLYGKRRLIIIPHNELGYLPMELLVGQSRKYFFEQFATSYNYSLSFLKKEIPASNHNQLIAFAPFASTHSPINSLDAIPASKDEVSALNGEILIDSFATKQRFIQQAPKMEVVHLATHALANDSLPAQSYIAFYPYQQKDTAFKLYEPEIFNLDLRSSKLIILSACETGKGKLVHGEGMLSLSRAFSYAGCPSIITSLWKADDQATAYLSKRLHHYLSKGLPKDIALQKARMDYLHDKDIPNQFKQPHYWSHLVLVGDSSPLNSSFNFWWIILGAMVAAGIIVLFVVKRKKAPLAKRGFQSS